MLRVVSVFIFYRSIWIEHIYMYITNTEREMGRGDRNMNRRGE